jgi:glycosyltransferase involved in cell wall biosynthesis
MNNPLVSVLIPAYRPDWLDIAIAGVLAQTYQNFEIIIGDDCPTVDVKSVVSKWGDQRIRYQQNPNRGLPGSNRDFLINSAQGEYIKFVFDDDFLMQKSIQSLVSACLEYNCKLAFHRRYFVDGLGRVYSSDDANYGFQKEFELITKNEFFQKIIKQSNNCIGEPSNILIHTETLRSIKNPFAISDRRMRYLTDVALYSNFASKGESIIGIKEYGSAFRKHEKQTSAEANSPIRSANFYEWDYLLRWATHNQYLSISDFREVADRHRAIYVQLCDAYPELYEFLKIPNEDKEGSPLSSEFIEAINLADAAVAMRILNKKS